jgi:hypothetical protein
MPPPAWPSTNLGPEGPCLVEAVVVTGLLRQQIGVAVVGGGTEAVAGRAVDADADEVRCGLVGVGLRLLGLGRVGAEDRRDVNADVFQDRAGGRDAADVAAGAGVWHPGRRGIHALCGEHVEGGVGRRAGIGGVEERRGPVGEGDARVAVAVGQEIPEAVGDRHAVAVTIDARQGGEDIGRGV